MELTKLKIELYDIAAIVVPGIFCIAEIWTAFFGLQSLLRFMHDLKGTELTLVVLCSFATGNLVQEAGNWLLLAWKGKRFFKNARDEFWKTNEGALVRAKMKTESACDLENVDSSFEYCLTRISGKFIKRDVFVAISDFSRSLWLLSLFALFPAVRLVIARRVLSSMIGMGLGCVGLIGLVAWLSWLRMVRFRALSETPVFTTFLACATSGTGSESSASKEEGESIGA